MSRRCEICGKGTMSGNTVSKSKNHQRRTWKPNLVEVKTEIEGTTTTEFTPAFVEENEKSKNNHIYNEFSMAQNAVRQ